MGERDNARHLEVIKDFLVTLNKKTDKFILKGGTALLLRYELDRFSEDVDLNGLSRNFDIVSFCNGFCEKRGYRNNLRFDRELRFKTNIHYLPGASLRIEVGYDRIELGHEYFSIYEGIRIHDIQSLAVQKSKAYRERDKLRDLYDMVFIVSKYYDTLPEWSRAAIYNALALKGPEQFDHFVRSGESDPLIDMDKLEDNFLHVLDKLGLLFNQQKTSRDDISSAINALKNM